ncbi:hypothetical protein RchiOBHm_Chr2g0164321 [Rosa chinensis]|uniref:Uncharacterized protein n=1 Tax=Rosa chinensis TaxID=74649 RepID=A0A2P6S3I0_ROSCH|nr:hypothetical protein RchiOBHm_Chr2g0164321 [Rosa chinensis]
MKKEIDASCANDISQGGLTQGQQTQISRNEKRTEQLKNFTRTYMPALLLLYTDSGRA